MDKAEFFASELSRLEAAWTADASLKAVAEAVALCGWNEWPLPEWCVRPALDALWAFNQASEGRGKRKRASITATREQKRLRHHWVAHFLKHGTPTGKKNLTVEQAAEEVAEMMKSQNVTGRTVMQDYYEVESTLK